MSRRLPNPNPPSSRERPSDDDLVVRCGRGDATGLAELMHRHQAAAYRYAWRIFRDHQTAEDLTQDLFVRIFRTAPRYRPEGRFTTWFYRILTNLCFDLLRRRKRREAVSGVLLDPVACEGTPMEPWMECPDLDVRFRREEARRVIREGLQTLPAHVRAALELREFEGLPYREIAEVLDISTGEVKVLLHRGRRLLQHALRGSPLVRQLLEEAGDDRERPRERDS